MGTVNLAENVRVLAEQITERAAVELVHVEITALKNKRVVRVYIDKEDGVTHEDCSVVSRELEELLDKADPIEGGYLLEVSSPGIERGLYKLADFERFKGNEARLKTLEPIDGRRSYRGLILGVVGQCVEFRSEDGEEVRIEFDRIKSANLTFDLDKELKDSRQKNKKSRAR